MVKGWNAHSKPPIKERLTRALEIMSIDEPSIDEQVELYDCLYEAHHDVPEYEAWAVVKHYNEAGTFRPGHDAVWCAFRTQERAELFAPAIFAYPAICISAAMYLFEHEGVLV